MVQEPSFQSHVDYIESRPMVDDEERKDGFLMEVLARAYVSDSHSVLPFFAALKGEGMKSDVDYVRS